MSPNITSYKREPQKNPCELHPLPTVWFHSFPSGVKKQLWGPLKRQRFWGESSTRHLMAKFWTEQQPVFQPLKSVLQEPCQLSSRLETVTSHVLGVTSSERASQSQQNATLRPAFIANIQLANCFFNCFHTKLLCNVDWSMAAGQQFSMSMQFTASVKGRPGEWIWTKIDRIWEFCYSFRASAAPWKSTISRWSHLQITPAICAVNLHQLTAMNASNNSFIVSQTAQVL